ncbi:MAG: toprim domain-containing protein [Pseudomonadales bacterium]|nr:toprim domain-containing protein [Pseudomonadales bacterium]
MKNPITNDKIVIAKGNTNIWIYFSVRDDSDNGTIIEFVQNRSGLNLGKLRIELRPWIGRPANPNDIAKYVSHLEPASYSRSTVLAMFSNSRLITESEYLCGRGLALSTIVDSRFKSMVKEDRNGNTIFPHYDKDGLSGYEIKNYSFTGFAKSGQRSFWTSQCYQHDKRLVLSESAVDSLSYHQLHGDEFTRHLSSAGTLSGHQQKVLIGVFSKLPDGFEVVTAFDNDEAGEKYREIIKELVPSRLELRDHAPDRGCNDWNKVLSTSCESNI